jgi:hypothetical protein
MGPYSITLAACYTASFLRLFVPNSLTVPHPSVGSSGFRCTSSFWWPADLPLQYVCMLCWMLEHNIQTTYSGKKSRVEAGSNTSTFVLRVVGGDEKGSLESETLKYGRVSHGTRTREWLSWPGPAGIVNDRPALCSERAPHINKTATVWQ